MVASTGNDLLDKKINEWVAWNKNDKFANELNSLLETADTNTLSRLFLSRLEFGTAGLRARMGPGYAQMNDLVVIQTAQGLLRYLEASTDENLTAKGIVVGYDGRYNSKRFAELTANVFARKDIPVYLYSRFVPTPFVPFGVTKFGAAAGIMVTASHNPKEDNGYKVYWSNGVQFVSPHDKNTLKSIEDNLEPWENSWDTSFIDNTPLVTDPLESVRSDYYPAITRHLVNSSLNAVSPVTVTYTAMHGVGYPYIVDAFTIAKLKAVVPVDEQVQPDPEFPTVRFPNPEEGKETLNLAMAKADSVGSKLILANDPDADRLAVAEKQSDGTWKVFTGNELGGLLGWWVLYVYKMRTPKPTYRNVYTLSSTVSSKILRTIALAQGFAFEEALTGFKWLGNESDRLIKEGKEVIFAFEEAIGFMCRSVVLDKDGISAAVHVTELATYLYSRGETLSGKLESIYDTYGYHISDNSYFICHEPKVTAAIFNRLRTFSGSENTYPESILNGQYKVINVRDLTTGYDSTKNDKKATLPTSSSSQMITFWFDTGLVATLRTSGTEPKLKYYTEFCASPQLKDKNLLVEMMNEMVQGIIDEFLEPEKNGLIYRT